MKKISIYLTVVLIITILIPTVIVKTFNFVPILNKAQGQDVTTDPPSNPINEKPLVVGQKSIERVKIYNSDTKKTIELSLSDYVKGVVAAEMPAAFHIEALKAQAIAARTYAISRIIKYEEGHPDHPEAPLCTGVHCQAYLSLEELEKIHGKEWVENYWGKIETAVDSTSNLVIYYQGELIEPLYHSTSGGKTEDAVNVFAMDSPYLKSVESPYEEDAPRFREVVTLTVDEFLDKLKEKYPKVNINKENFHQKIKLIEKTESGRVTKLAIDREIVSGREIRELYGLNSTNFEIVYDIKLGLIEIETLGYGHGVGMSQWGANGMAKQGKTYEVILKHYYTGVVIKKL